VKGAEGLFPRVTQQSSSTVLEPFVQVILIVLLNVLSAPTTRSTRSTRSTLGRRTLRTSDPTTLLLYIVGKWPWAGRRVACRNLRRGSTSWLVRVRLIFCIYGYSTGHSIYNTALIA